MILYYHLKYVDKESFPKEIGEKIFSLQEDKILNGSYSVNNNSFIDNEVQQAKLPHVKKLNFLVGSNNSGKSRFLRSLFKLNGEVSEDNLSLTQLHLDILDSPIISQSSSMTDFEIDVKKIWGSVLAQLNNPHNPKDVINFIQTIKEIYLSRLPDLEEDTDEHKSYRECFTLLDLILVLMDKVQYNDVNNRKDKLYIPVLRSAISDKNLQPSSYLSILKNIYNLDQSVYTGLDLYDKIDELHNSVEIGLLEGFSNWVRKNFYNDYEIQIVPVRKNKNVHLKIDSNLTPIFDIGDGVQQLILLMFPIYTAKNGTWFYIEEPETHLHPGLQRIFIETLLNDKYLKGKNLRYFFTTHSNHFLDISIDHNEISLFQFQKQSPTNFNIKTDIKPSKEILDLLGINTSSVFLSNTSIWVEGPTDRKYVSMWLKLFCEAKNLPYLKEDIDFAFFEYGGNLIEHYLFNEKFDEDVTENQVREKIKSFALSNKIYLLSDNDNVKEGSAKYERRKKLEAISSKHFKYQNTEYREIENLLPPALIMDFLPQLISTGSTRKIQIQRDEYLKVGLGDFYNSILVQAKVTPRKFKAKSGTLKNIYKNKLCDFVINSTITYSDLVQDNQYLDTVVANLYSFLTSK